MRKVLLLSIMLGWVVVAQYMSWHENSDVLVVHERIADNPVDRYVPSAEPVGTVIVAHGFSANKTLMKQWGYSLARQGFDVFIYDQPGHGQHAKTLPSLRSGLAENPLGRNLQAIASQLLQEGRAQPGRLALVGHSMGSTAAVSAALQDERLGPVVAISLGTSDVPPDQPADLLLVAAERDTPSVLRVVQSLDRPVEMVGGRNHITVIFDQDVMNLAARWIHERFGTSGPAAGDPTSVWVWIGLAMAGAVGLVLAVGHLLAPEESGAGATPLPVVPLTALATMGVAAFSAVLAGAFVRVPGLGLAVADYLVVYFLVMAAVFGALRWVWPREFAFHLAPEGEPFIVSLLRGVGLFLAYAGGIGVVIHMNLSYFVPSMPRLLPLTVLFLVTWLFLLQEDAMKRGMNGWVAAIIGLLSRGIIMATWLGAAALPNPPMFLPITIPVAGTLLIGLELIGLALRHWRFASGSIATFQALVLAWSMAASFPLV